MKVTRRGFIKALGATFAVAVLPIGWEAAHQPRTFVIAAHDAPDQVKAAADIVCIGRNDQDVINQVTARGDSVFMSGGTFHVSEPIRLSSGGSRIVGCQFIADGDYAMIVDEGVGNSLTY